LGRTRQEGWGAQSTQGGMKEGVRVKGASIFWWKKGKLKEETYLGNKGGDAKREKKNSKRSPRWNIKGVRKAGGGGGKKGKKQKKKTIIPPQAIRGGAFH